jgi:hypothetical protein
MRPTTIVETGLLLVGSALGCMSLSIGERTEVVSPDAGCCVQSGKVHLRPGELLMVYYPIPYPSPPNLVVDNDRDPWGECHVIEQRPDGFQVKNQGVFAHDVRWTTRGLKGNLPPPLTPTPVTFGPVGPAAPEPEANSH